MKEIKPTRGDEGFHQSIVSGLESPNVYFEKMQKLSYYPDLI